MKRFLFLLTVLLLAGMARLFAQQPDTDPFYLTPQAGEWLICVASYTQTGPGGVDREPGTDPDAAAKAHDLAQEIRTKNKAPAYVFDFNAEERAKQLAEIRHMLENCPKGHFRATRIREQYAVVVGGYKDSETARKELDKIKNWPFPDERFCGMSARIVPGVAKDEGRAQISGQNYAKGEKGYFVEQVKFSPFSNAFVVRNPLVPKEDNAPKNVADDFTKRINKDETYNLLEHCKSPWTLTVAVFQSPPVVQGHSGSSSFLDKLMGRSGGEQLAASAMNAHNLAEVLRKLGYETYVLHTRFNSVVTVGGYKSKDDPRLQQMAEVLKQRFKMDERVRLLAQPLPMEVPKS
jgi:hypothetical protein